MNLKIKKTCSCGRKFDSIPANAKYFDGEGFEGYYFNCECKSTLFFPCKKPISNSDGQAA